MSELPFFIQQKRMMITGCQVQCIKFSLDFEPRSLFTLKINLYQLVVLSILFSLIKSHLTYKKTEAIVLTCGITAHGILHVPVCLCTTLSVFLRGKAACNNEKAVSSEVSALL